MSGDKNSIVLRYADMCPDFIGTTIVRTYIQGDVVYTWIATTSNKVVKTKYPIS